MEDDRHDDAALGDPAAPGSLDGWALFLDNAVGSSPFETRMAIGQFAPLRNHEHLVAGDAGLPERDPITEAVALAFGYHVEHEEVGPRRRVVLAPYQRGSGAEQYPPSIQSLPDDVIEVWTLLLDRVRRPYIEAHFAHLLFERRQGDRRRYALRASDAYRAAAAEMDSRMNQVDTLHTALRLARAVGDADRQDAAEASLRGLALEWLADGERPLGMVVRVVTILADERPPPGDLDDLLAAALGRCGDASMTDRLLALQRRRAGTDGRRDELDEARIGLWLREADTTEGHARARHLETAIRLAQQAGRSDLAAAATARLQRLNPDELGFAQISASIHTSRDEVEALIAPVTEAASWREALDQFSVFGPLSGLIDDNREQVAEQAQLFPLSQLMPPRQYRDGLPHWAPETPEELADYQLSQQESLRLNAMGPFAAIALRRIVDRHGLPTESEVAVYLAERPLVRSDLAGALSRCLLRYWLGDYEGAAFTVAPRIETLVRNLVRFLDEGVYRLQAGQAPGRFAGLGSLLPILQSRDDDRRIDPSWWRFVYAVTVNPAGLNLRSSIAHGLVNGIGDWPAALLLQAALHLTLYGPMPEGAAADLRATDEAAQDE